MPKSKCRLTFEFEDERRARHAAGILQKETAFKKRGSAEVRIKNRALQIVIDADDTVAMRAMLNTYLRMLQAVEDVSGAVGKTDDVKSAESARGCSHG